MYAKTGAAVIAALVIAGCSGTDRPVDEDASTASVQASDTAARADSTGAPGMAGMDHGNMPGMRGDTQAASGAGMAGMDDSSMAGMARTGSRPGAGDGMDRSNMPGMQTAGGAAADMGGMDHSRMEAAGDRNRAATPAATRMAETDHRSMNMSGQPTTMQGMDHAGMSGMQSGAAAGLPADDAGMEKLRALVAELVQDPVVQARIQADSALRQRWADEGVRRVLLNRP